MNAPGPALRSSRTGLLLAALVLLCVPPAGAQTAAADRPAAASESSLRALEARIEELERRLGSSALLDLVARVDRLENEIKDLRDRGEVEARSLESLRGRQKDLYAELDRLAQRLATPAPVVAAARPEDAAAPGQPDEPGADPAIAAVVTPGSGEPGEAGESDVARPERPPSGEAVGGEVSDAAPGPESAPKYDPVEEQESYQLAFDLLSEGRFERCVDAYTNFLAAFPESRYQDTARFWKGDCLYALRRFEPALEEFRALVEDHPESPRIPDARLKIGFILHELGRPAEAVEELRALVEAVPESSAAKLARDRLERLQ